MDRVASITEQRGFSFVEMLIGAAILGPLVITSFITVESMGESYRKSERVADLQQSARIAMARIVGELRSAGLDPSRVIPHLPIQAAIQTAEAGRIAFVGDVNGDNKTEKIEYRLDLSANPPVLRRQQWSTWDNGWSRTNGAQPLAESITSAEFTYFGAGGKVIPSSEISTRIGEISLVEIIIIAGEPVGYMPPVNYPLVSRVRLRNVDL